MVTRGIILLPATPAPRPVISPSQTQSLFLLAMYPRKILYPFLIPSLIPLLPSTSFIDEFQCFTVHFSIQ